MNKQVGWPVILLLLAILAAGLYAYYRYVFNAAPAPIDVAGEIPSKKPGDEKPAPPPPGVRVPGTINR